jgi:Protein of unknown function (DUF1552)
MGVSLALPWMEVLQRTASAQTAGAKRLLVFIHCNGVSGEHWYPNTPGTNYEIKFSLEPLAPFKDRMIVFGGVDLPSTKGFNYSGHTRAGAHLLTCAGEIGKQFDGGGYPDSISFDQAVANHIGQTTPIKSLYTGVQVHFAASGNMPRARFSYSAPNTPVTPEHRPQLVFDQLSGFVQASDDPAQKAKADLIRAQRQSVLDFVEADLQGTTSALGTDDKARLDEYLTSVRKLETQVAGQVALSCDKIVPPGMVDVESDEAVVDVATQMLTLIGHAMQCDLTRVAVFQMQGEQSPVQYQDTGHPLVQSLRQGHHGLSHHPDESIARICALHSTFLADFAKSLDAIPEDTGTMLDNTIILYTNGLENGEKHNHENLPHVVLGGTHVLNTGQYAKFEGRSTNDLYVTLFKALGIDQNTFGRPDLVSGELPGVLA